MAGAAVRNVMVRVGADTRNLSRGMQQAQRTMQQAGTRLAAVAKTVGIAMTAAFATVATLGVKSAMEYEAALQQVNRIFGENAKAMEDWAKNNAIGFNMSRSEAIKYSSVYGNLISGIAKDQAENAQLTQTLLKQSAVVASATGRTMEDVMDRIRSGLLGNTEAIEDLGINVNVAMLESTDAFRRFANGKSWDQLDFKTQQQIRLMAILEQSMNKFGGEVNKNTNSSIAQLTAQLKNVGLVIGQAFLPMINTVVPYLVAFARKLEEIALFFKAFMEALFGVSNEQKKITVSGATATKSTTGLGKAVDKAGKKAKGAVAGFDEVNTLAENIADSAGGAADSMSGIGGASMPSLDMPEIDMSKYSGAIEVAKKLRENLGKLFQFIKDNKTPIVVSLGAIAGAFIGFKVAMLALNGAVAASKLAGVFGRIGVAIADFVSIMLRFPQLGLTMIFPELAAAATALGVSIGALVGIIAAVVVAVAALGAAIALYFMDPNFKKFVDDTWNGICTTISNVIKAVWDVIMKIWAPIANVLEPEFKRLQTIATDIWNGILKVVTDVWNGIQKAWDDVKKALEPAITAFGNMVSEIWNKLQDAGTSMWNKIKETWDVISVPLKAGVQAFSDFMTPIWEGIKLLATGVWEAIKVYWEFIWNSGIKPVIELLGATFASIFNNVKTYVTDSIDAVVKIFNGFMDFIQGVFTGNWKKAWQGIAEIFGGIFDGIKAVFKGVINYIIDMINYMVKQINKIKIDIPQMDIMGKKIGGQSIGFNIQEIPRLANGGIVNGATTFMAGEAGAEAIVPLENSDFISKFAEMISQNQNGNGNAEVTINIDGSRFARVMAPLLNKEANRRGNISVISVN